MGTGIDIQYVQEAYRQMSNEELIRIATQDAQGLTPEAMDVAKAEIKKRGLDDGLAKGLDAQNKTYTPEEVDAYCDILRNVNCPGCGDNSVRLNGSMTGEVVSFIFFTQYKKQVRVACPGCLDKATNNALIKTALLGWWGIPWGIIYTIQSIILNLESKKVNHSTYHSNYLRGFTLDNIGQLETYKDNKEMLQGMLWRLNAQ